MFLCSKKTKKRSKRFKLKLGLTVDIIITAWSILAIDGRIKEFFRSPIFRIYPSEFSSAENSTKSPTTGFIPFFLKLPRARV